MIKLGIISDTHTCWDDRFALHFKECDQIWHAGDIGDISVIERLRGVVPEVVAVRGNIDHGVVARSFPEIECRQLEGIRIWMTHIGGYPGRYAPGVRRMLVGERPQLMIAGHSHILKVMYDHELGLLHVNPGAAGHHGWQKERTLVRLVIDGNQMRDLEVIELGKLSL